MLPLLPRTIIAIHNQEPKVSNSQNFNHILIEVPENTQSPYVSEYALLWQQAPLLSVALPASHPATQSQNRLDAEQAEEMLRAGHHSESEETIEGEETENVYNFY